MTQTTATATHLDGFDELLQDLDREPGELSEELRERREAAMGQGALARDLDRVELDHLRRRARDRRLADDLAPRVAKARNASLQIRLRSLEAAEAEVGVLFDLVELGAECAHLGLVSESVRAELEFERRAAVIDTADEELRYEAGERFATLSTEDEELALGHRVERLTRMRQAFVRLGEQTGDALFSKLKKRLDRQLCDRTLERRLQSVLTARGAAALEMTSLVLLVAIFVLLGIEVFHGQKPWIPVVDASICLFFIAEFAFKFALAPDRRSWFLRNFLTDLLPAIPATFFFFPVEVPPGGEATIAVRVVRVLRIFVIARYVRALRPLLSIARLILFLIKGIDSLVRRFRPLLNRNFVFFERAVVPLESEGRRDLRSRLFDALRREQVLLADLPVHEARPILCRRADALAARLDAAPVDDEVARRDGSRGHLDAAVRDIPVEHAIEFLWRLRPGELGFWLPRKDILALDRVVRIVNAPVVRSLPLLRSIRSPERLATAEERVIDLGRRVALLLEAARERVLHVADMHGIVTGPQVLDRVASTIVKFAKRPAVRLLMFGGLFALVRMLVGADSAVGQFLSKFVATPLIVLGSVCLVFLVLGRWLKSLAGEAADTFKLTSEAHFIGLVELVKRRQQDRDLNFLANRVFGADMPVWEAASGIGMHIRAARLGIVARPGGQGGAGGDGVVDESALPTPDPDIDREIYRVALLYLHFLDGAPLHENDVKTTEQLIANLSLENIRVSHLNWTRKDRKRLKRLAPGETSLFRGPYVWFRFITESVAVEAAKRVTEYNRHCLTLQQRSVASQEERDKFAHWVARRRSPRTGRLDKTEPPGTRIAYRTTEFNALDFLTEDPQRARHVEAVFGRSVLRLLRRDRERMIREIFGTRPLHRLPRSQRTVNAFRFYESRLSRGRVFLSPLFALFMTFVGLRMIVQKTVEIVREILAPDRVARDLEAGRAPFSVALRKIHRMKGPTLLEAMRLRAMFDPVYCGAPASWSHDEGFDAVPELERDMDFLGMPERDRESLRDIARANRERVEELHHLMQRLGTQIGGANDDPIKRRRGERAVTIAYMTDQREMRTLFRAESWFEDRLVEMESRDTELPGYLPRRLVAWVVRGFRRHPVDRWIRTRLGGRVVSRRGRSNFKRAWHDGDDELRGIVTAWLARDPGADLRGEAIAVAERFYAMRDDVSRELSALRAVQSLSVLDVRNYRELIFELGGYAKDGEEPALAHALP